MGTGRRTSFDSRSRELGRVVTFRDFVYFQRQTGVYVLGDCAEISARPHGFIERAVMEQSILTGNSWTSQAGI